MPTPIDGILLGDQGDSAVPGSERIVLLRDLNGDGDAADAGEQGTFFDGTNASGLVDPVGNVFTLVQASDHAVYAGDGDTDAVYRLLDRNRDGDANDAGEATVWLSEANAAGLTLPTPNGIAEGADGAIYVVNAGVSSRPTDSIYRTVDLNGDGDANDAGEAEVWLNLQAIVPTSSPYELSFIGDTAYLIDPSGSAEDTVFAIRDTDGSGDIQRSEVVSFATKTATGAAIDFSADADGNTIVVWQWLDQDDGGHSVFRFTDLDGSGVIDQPNETTEIWNTSELPAGFVTNAGFSIAADGRGRIVVTSNDSEANGDNVYMLTDVNGDGDYFDDGESNVYASRSLSEDALHRPRSLAFYEGPGDNAAPTARDDAFVAEAPGAVVTGDVLANNGMGPDADIDGDALSVVAVNGEQLDGRPVTLASGARVTIAADGTFSYDANGAFARLQVGETATDTFTYTVADGEAFPATLSTADIDGTNGTKFVGEAQFDMSGAAVSGAGDVNGDGLDDLIIAAPQADPNGKDTAGATYVVFGTGESLGAEFDLGSLDGTNGYRIEGQAEEWAGISISAAGDVDGDGIDDMVIGAHYADAGGATDAGATYVVYGTDDARGASFDLGTIDGTNGFRLGGASAGDYTGLWVNDAGDVNGDGFADVIVGAPSAAPQGRQNAGTSYVVFGSAEGPGAELDLGSLDGTNGFALEGAAAHDDSGYAVASAGDINGDGFDDVVVGAALNDPDGREEAGASYVVFGKADGFDASLDFNDVDGTNGFVLEGGAEGDYVGISVSSAGDFNGDGIDDVLVGARLASPDGRAGAGESYIVFGTTEGFGQTLDLSTLDGTQGLRLIGAEEGDGSGINVSGIGDVNGDGVDDVAIGATAAAPNGDYAAGQTHIVYGSRDTLPGAIDLGALDGEDGFTLEGSGSGSFTGYYNAPAGDLNDDGVDDFIVSAPFTQVDGSYSVGASYVVYGRPQPGTDTATVTITATGLARDTTVGAGNHFSLFLDADSNTVYAAGENVAGQLGQGVTGFDVAAPIAIATPDGFDGTIVSVAAGLLHGAFLTDAGEVYTWGDGNLGRLGHGDQVDRLVATKVAALDGVTVAQIVMGNGASYAIDDEGTLYGWGQNSNGQLGLGDAANRLVPTEIEIPGTVTGVSAGTSHTLVLTADGSVYGFGSNIDGQVGDPTAVDGDGDPVRSIATPVEVVGLPADIVAVTADTQSSYAVTSDGRVFGWGENEFGQLLVGADNGDGTFTPNQDKVLTPVELTGLPDGVVDVKGGARWVAALTEDGEVWLWGPNDEGPSGGLDGDPATPGEGTFYPQRVAGLSDIVELQTGPNHIIAVAADGTVHSFGSNSDGRLGYPTPGSTTTPGVVPVGEDVAPYLLAATPADEGRDVAAGADLVLTFTEAVEVGSGRIRLVNRDDPADVVTVRVTDPFSVLVDGDTVTVDPARALTPGARYAVEIDAGAFVDRTGNPVAGIAAGDIETWDFIVSADPVTPGLVVRADGSPADVVGSAGDDSLTGAGGADRLTGDGGDDWLNARNGDDVVVGGAGKDRIWGKGGDDTVTGGADDDRADLGDGDDLMHGNSGDDIALGGAGADELRGGDGDDTLDGGTGDDSLYGGDGDDALIGGAGRNIMRGGHGDDTIRAGDDGDRILGGGGDDLIVGGAGADLFRYAEGNGADTVVGAFSGAAGALDRIQLAVAGFDDFADVLAVASEDDDDVVITLAPGDSLRLVGTALADLDAADFLFV